jgi:PhnB protein
MIAAYLTFDGKAEEAFTFYKSVLGGKFNSLQRFGDTPHGDNMTETDKKKVMHMTFESPEGTIMGNDHLDFMGPFTPGNTMALSIHPQDVERAKKVFDGLSKGGNVIMPLEKVYWGSYFGMLTDAFGIKWLVNCAVNE